MKKSQPLDELLPYRMQQAEQALESALLLLDTDRAASVNRLYYCAFYALTALALSDGHQFSKHAQLIGWFNKEWINTGKMDKNHGKAVRELFDKRQQSDYEAFVSYEKDEVAVMIPSVEEILEKIKTILSGKALKP